MLNESQVTKKKDKIQNGQKKDKMKKKNDVKQKEMKLCNQKFKKKIY